LTPTNLTPDQLQIVDLISSNPRMRSVLIAQAVADVVLDSIGALVVDLIDGTILYTTRRVEEMFGYLIRGELIGQCVEVLVPPGIRPNHEELRAKFARRPEPRLMGMRDAELNGVRADGSVFPVEISLTAVRLPEFDGKKCVIAEVIDMTRR
jgi:two-component system, sensor histidine kinase and response regulator